MKKTIILSCCLLGWGVADLQAQNNTVAAGGEAFGNGGTVSYSIGQVACITVSGSTGIITQGVQQPYEIFVVTGLEEAKDITLQCFAYPNPAAGYVKLKVENIKTENLAYQLYDINGKLLENNKVEGNETSLDISHLAASIYFLKITGDNKEIKIFEIIKK